jgi:hypothetical protein
MHSTDNLDDGYIGSGTRLWHSIKKHGRENFMIEILEFLPSRQALKFREADLITEEILNHPKCMNLRLGGEGGWDHVNQPGNWKGFGNLKKPEVHAKTVKAWKLAVSERRLDPIYEDRFVTIRKEGRAASPCFTGRKHSEESKERMRAVDRTGVKNSQHGTCWIFSEQEQRAMKIKQTEFDHYNQRGWCRGRKSGK